MIPDYKYWATVDRVVDGDTIYATVDLGFNIYTWLKLRLTDINTPEIYGSEKEQGLVAKAFVETLIPAGSKVFIESYKDGGFGRWAATIWYLDENQQWVSLNDTLLETGLATPS